MDIKRNIWLFGASKWQSNPKALYLYMAKYHKNKECWWIADTEEQLNFLHEQGIFNVEQAGTKKANELFSKASYYVVEQFRESYPESINENIIIVNLWHGVGLKHVEFGLGEKLTDFSPRIVKKNIKFNNLYKKNLFLTTSEKMEEHFIKEMKLNQSQIIRGDYPRNIVYKNSNISTYNHELIEDRNLSDYTNICIYAPTFRKYNLNNIVNSLLSDFDRLVDEMEQQNNLFIIKVHPLMENDSGYINIKEKYSDNKNILFWPDNLDIYEIFHKIDIAIVDYSSIFYDFLNVGIKKFIRYVPDYELQIQSDPFTLDYFDYTGGEIADSFDSLINILKKDINPISNKEKLIDYFFGYDSLENDKIKSLENLIKNIESHKLPINNLKKLKSFDIFDTIIKRNTLLPVGVFFAVQNKLRTSDLEFDKYFIEHYPKIRRESEADLRDHFRKTTFEREDDRLEIKFIDIFKRMSEVFNLTPDQQKYLINIEIEEELKSVEPNKTGLFHLNQALKNDIYDVILVSDMYLPKDVVLKLIEKIDPKLTELPLYLSTEIGYQKSTSKLFQHIFFDIDYKYGEWIHYGDNKHADGIVPRTLGIQTRNHDMDKFTPFENGVINTLNTYESYLLSTKMNRYRYEMLDLKTMSFNEEQYFAYAYIGLWLVPYVNWAIKDALNKKYETLYFISRDGYYLKEIADIIISTKNYNIKTKYIYGSRKVWRFAIKSEKIEELFISPYGVLGGINTFDEIVAASQLEEEEELINLIPNLQRYKNYEKFTPEERIQIGNEFINSEKYLNFLQKYCSERFNLVTKYLEQEIDFTENFAFVEFWGRGYTQDLLTELLKETSHKEIKNPFYYVRSIYGTHKQSIRHRFMQNSINFWFLEPIFSTVQYESVRNYLEIEGEVYPELKPNENTHHDNILKGLKSFTKDYTEIFYDDYSERILAEYAYLYFSRNPNDQYICNVFGELEDNTGTFQEMQKVAPILTEEDILNLKNVNISSLTLSLPISLSRSNEKIRNTYLKYQKSIGNNSILPNQLKRIFPVNPLDNYIKIHNLPLVIVSLKKQTFFTDISWRYKASDTIDKNEFIEVLNIVWTNSGVPRLYTEKGYLTASKDWVKPINKILLKRNIPVYISEDNIYENNHSKQLHKGDLIDIKGIRYFNNESYFLTELGFISSNQNNFDTIDLDSFPLIEYIKDSFENKKHTKIKVMKDIKIFSNLDLKKPSIYKNKYVTGSIAEIESISFNNNFDIVLRTKLGYILPDSENFKFVCDDIENYLHDTPSHIRVLKNLTSYNSINFTENDKNIEFKENDILSVLEIMWTDEGFPILKLEDNSYISSELSNIAKVRTDIEKYITSYKGNVILLKKQFLYSDLEFNNENKLNFAYEKDTIVYVQDVLWTQGGTPRLLTDKGYLSANLEFIKPIIDEINDYLFLNLKYVRILKDLVPYKLDDRHENCNNSILRKNEIIEVLYKDFDNQGQPVLYTKVGYILAHKSNISKVRSDYKKYITDYKGIISLKKEQFVYSDLDLKNKVSSKLDIGHTLEVLDIIWTEGGTPRLKTNDGFISANLEFIEIL